MTDKHEIEETIEHEELDVQDTEEFSLDDLQEELNRPDPEEVKAQTKAVKEAEDAKNLAFANQINSTFWFVMGTRWLTPNAVANMSPEAKAEGAKAFMPLAEKLDGEVPGWLTQFIEKYDWAIASGMYLLPTISALVANEKAIKAELAKQAAANDESQEDKGTGTDGG